MRLKRLTFMACLGASLTLGSLVVSQEIPSPDLVASTSYTNERVVSGPRLTGSRDSADMREFAMLARIQLVVAVGTRWQVERPLQENRLLLVMTPAPIDLVSQLTPYRRLNGLRVRLDRSTTKMAVLEFEGIDDAPLFIHAGTRNKETRQEDRMMMGTSQRGVIERSGGLTIHVGRLRRYAPWQEFCRLARTPLGVTLDKHDPDIEQFERAEALFSHGEDIGANEIYASIAEALKPQGFTSRGKVGISFRKLSASELASFRLADVSLCQGQVRSARLRYDVLYHRPERTTLEILAGLSWIQLAHPDVDRGEAESLSRALSRTDKSPLAPRAVIHSARVKLLLGHPQEALESVRSLGGNPAAEPFKVVAESITLRALAALISKQLADKNDIGLVTSVAANSETVLKHPRAMTISLETAEAYRRLLLPKQCIETLQTAMGRVEGAPQDILLVGVLARCYRDAGDRYRATRTLDYLVEQMEHRSTWLSRKQESVISLAAAEAALDNKQWSVASRWLARASLSGSGKVVTALKAYVDGEAALKAGKRDDAVGFLLAAFDDRQYISALRRDSISLRVSEVAFEAGMLRRAEHSLRILMEETESADVEVEAAYHLANVLKARGDDQRSLALLAEVESSAPESTYGLLASEMRERIEFKRRHGSTLRTAGLFGPQSDAGSARPAVNNP